MIKIIRTSTVSISLKVLLKGQLSFLSKHFEVVGISSPDESLLDVSKREGIRTIGVKMERGISPFKDFISLVKLYLLLRREKPQIIHSITPKAGLLTMLAGKMAGVPIRMHTFTGLIFPTRTGFTQTLLIKMDQLLCWAATNIYPEGNGVKQDLIKFKITSKPLKVLANGNVNGIDLSYFDPDGISMKEKVKLRQKWQIDNDDFVYVFVGRLVGDKGINELIEAFRALSRKQSKIKLLLVGAEEAELDPLQSHTLEEIMTNINIISVGFQSDVRPYLATANCLVFPSYREGFPNVVIQAGAMDLPSIVTDINGCNEIIIEGKNGTIVPSKNVLAIQNAMDRIFQDSLYYEELRSNARKMIVDRYEQKVVWKAILDEYRNLIKWRGLNANS